MLRASAGEDGGGVDLATVMGRAGGDGGIAHGGLLVDYAEAVIGDDEDRLIRARASVIACMGADALIDAAAVAALFNGIDRVADGTAIPLEEEKIAAMADFRAAFPVGANSADRQP